MAKKLKSGNASSSKRESSLPIPIILAISITIIGISLSLLNNYNWGRSSESSLSSPPSTPSFPSNPSTLPDKTADTIPTYDEYLILAKQHHWIPSDPLQKLKDVSYKSSQIINLYNSTQTHEYMKLISQEVQFLLQVLIKSTNHTFDLTEIFFESLEGIHRTFYHLEKQLLQHNKERSSISFFLYSFSSYR